jgi:hypothetical protein
MSGKGSNDRNRLEGRWKNHFRNTSCDGDRFESTEESRFLHRGVGASPGNVRSISTIRERTLLLCGRDRNSRHDSHIFPRHDLVVVEVGHSDTDHTTCLHVPSVGLVVAGDVAYNDVHLYRAESNAQTRREWIAALAKIELLNPRAVIAGHKRAGNDDSPKIIDETRQYIRDFDREAGQRRPREDSTTKRWSSIRIGSIRVERSGFRARRQTVI